MIDFMVAEREDLDDDNQSDLSISSVDTSDLSDFEEISSSDEEIDDGEEWSDTVRDHDLHHFRSHSGPKIPLNFDAKPIDYFLQLFPEDLMRKIVYETNLYAQQKGATNFEPTHIEEMRAYFGILFLMGLCRLPNYRCYWSTEPELRYLPIANIMPRNRYEEKKTLHILSEKKKTTFRKPEIK